jgi:hypothetical protein
MVDMGLSAEAAAMAEQWKALLSVGRQVGADTDAALSGDAFKTADARIKSAAGPNNPAAGGSGDKSSKKDR